MNCTANSKNKLIPVPDPDKSAISDIPAPPLRWVSIFRLFGFQGCITPKYPKYEEVLSHERLAFEWFVKDWEILGDYCGRQQADEEIE